MAKKKKRKLSRLHPLFVPLGIEKIGTLSGQIFGKVGKIERALVASDRADGPYRYFVAYYFKNHGFQGLSNKIVEVENRILTEDDLRAIELDIPEHVIRVINFILLDPEK